MNTTLSTTEKIDILGRARIFHSVSYESLEHIASLSDQSSYSPDEIICEVGDPANHVCIIAEGTVAVTTTALNEPSHTMSRGDIFGEYGMFNEGIRTAKLTSCAETLVLTIHYDQFKSFLSTDASACLAILEETVQRLLKAESDN